MKTTPWNFVGSFQSINSNPTSILSTINMLYGTLDILRSILLLFGYHGFVKTLLRSIAFLSFKSKSLFSFILMYSPIKVTSAITLTFMIPELVLRSILLIIISLNDLAAIRISFLQNSTRSTVADIMSSNVHAISILGADIFSATLALSVTFSTNFVISSSENCLVRLRVSIIFICFVFAICFISPIRYF